MIGMVGSAASVGAGALRAATEARAAAMRSFFMVPPNDKSGFALDGRVHPVDRMRFLETTLTSSAGGQGCLQARLRHIEAARGLELDQAAEAAALLGVMIG